VTKGVKAVKFITAGLVPPPKEQVLAYLGIGTAPGQTPSNSQKELKRRGEIDVRSYFISRLTYLRDLIFSN
jgi:hypothetical protein